MCHQPVGSCDYFGTRLCKLYDLHNFLQEMPDVKINHVEVIYESRKRISQLCPLFNDWFFLFTNTFLNKIMGDHCQIYIHIYAVLSGYKIQGVMCLSYIILFHVF